MNFSNYYDLLDISRSADQNTIRKAYLQKAKQFHPDINKSEISHKMLEAINEAYETLKDPQKRYVYDLTLPVITEDSTTSFSSTTKRSRFVPELFYNWISNNTEFSINTLLTRKYSRDEIKLQLNSQISNSKIALEIYNSFFNELWRNNPNISVGLSKTNVSKIFLEFSNNDYLKKLAEDELKLINSNNQKKINYRFFKSKLQELNSFFEKNKDYATICYSRMKSEMTINGYFNSLENKLWFLIYRTEAYKLLRNFEKAYQKRVFRKAKVKFNFNSKQVKILYLVGIAAFVILAITFLVLIFKN